MAIYNGGLSIKQPTYYVVDQGSDKVYIDVNGAKVSHERWWRKWSDGRIEQGGYVGRDNISGGRIPGVTNVYMKLAFDSRATFYVECNISYNATDGTGTLPEGGHTIIPIKQFTDYFIVGILYGSSGKQSSSNRPFVWRATGY